MLQVILQIVILTINPIGAKLIYTINFNNEILILLFRLETKTECVEISMLFLEAAKIDPIGFDKLSSSTLVDNE